MTLTEARARARNKSGFSAGDRYAVINGATGEPLESHPTEQRAVIAQGWVNDHEERNGRARVYTVEALSAARMTATKP